MKRQAITILFVLLAAGMLTQCRTKNDAKIDNTAVSTPEISVQSTISSHIDSAAAEVKEVAKQVEDTLQRVPDTLQVQPQGEPHKGFVYVKSLIPDLIEDLRYFTTNNFMGVRADGYEANHAILSKEAATALSKAADELREKGYVVKIFDAYRPQRAVDHFVRWSKTDDQRNKKDYYPDLAKKSLFPQYIATKSGHTKGSTIDMTICYKDTQKEVPFKGNVSLEKLEKEEEPSDAARTDDTPRLQALQQRVVALHAEKRALPHHLLRFSGEIGRQAPWPLWRFIHTPKAVITGPSTH